MTWKISIELDTSAGNAKRLFEKICDWTETGDSGRIGGSIINWSPAVMLEPHHPDDDDLHEAVSLLRRLGFDTAAEAVQAARRNLNPTDPPNVTRLVSDAEALDAIGIEAIYKWLADLTPTGPDPTTVTFEARLRHIGGGMVSFNPPTGHVLFDPDATAGLMTFMPRVRVTVERIGDDT